MMRTAIFGATAVLTGCAAPTEQQVASAPPAPAPAAPALSEDLDVVKKAKGPVMTTLDEFYKVGPGPSSSHTIGPMRITYDFYQRCAKLPADQLAKVTGMKVHLFGSLSATGKGHGTERAALAGHHRQRARDSRTGIPRQSGREPGPDLPGETRRQDAHALAQGHHLRRAEGEVSPPEHDDLQVDGRRHRPVRAGVLLRRWRLHRVEGLPTTQEGPAQVSRTRR